LYHIRFPLELCPRPRWGSLQRSLRPLAEIFGALLPKRSKQGKGKKKEKGGKGGQGEVGGEGREMTPKRDQPLQP